MKISKKKSRAQITFMIILGLVIFISISFVFYLASSTTKKQIGKEATQSKQTRMNVQPIIEYVNQCLDKVSREGLQIMGKQAGFLFKTRNGVPQGGLEEEFDDLFKKDIFLEYPSTDSFDVAYAISNDFLDNKFMYPNYPWVEFPYDAYPSTQIVYSNPFDSGLDPNSLLFGTIFLLELYRHIGGIDSIQANLEAYVKSNVIECTKFNIFETQGYNITTDIENTYVNVTIGVNDVGFRLTYPLAIEYFDEKTQIQDFFTSQDIRFETIYNEVQRIIINDVNDITYDIGTPSVIPGVSIIVERNVLGKDDVIRVIDTQSKILDKPFEFRFARKNRKPALHYIPNHTTMGTLTPITLSGPYGGDNKIDNEQELSKALNESLISSFSLYLNASDPDEDALTFGFTDRFSSLTDGVSPSCTQDVCFPLTAGIYDILVNVTDGEFTDAHHKFAYYVRIVVT